jgi:antitoxin (DNA-binding transcriptional repressor) of toxin-antitoxin stability system
MPKTISATTAARKFREVLDAVEHTGEVFRIERHGRSIAEIGPTRTPRVRSTWGNVVQALRDGPQPDPDFAADVAFIRAAAGDLPTDPWARSSTPRS